jgi:hypothetical protein
VEAMGYWSSFMLSRFSSRFIFVSGLPGIELNLPLETLADYLKLGPTRLIEHSMAASSRLVNTCLEMPTD